MNPSIHPPAEEPSVEETFRILKTDVAERLRNACSDWSPDEFDALVEKVTRTAMKYPGSRFDRLLMRST